MPKKSPTKRLPSEVNWLHSNNSNTLHISFFNFFKTYDKRRAQIRFLEVVKCIEDESKRKKVLEDYDEWRKSREAKDFWIQRKQVDQDSTDSTTDQQTDTTNITTTEESIETISLADAKAIIIENIRPIDDDSNNLSFSNSLTKFKRDVYNSLDVSLTYETHLQHLLALSNILFIGKNSNWCPEIQNYFVDPIKTIRKNMYDSFGFNESNHKFPLDIMMAIITIVNDINCGLLTRLNAESKILAIINDITDTAVIRLLLCIKSMVETLPMVTQKKEIKEFELCTRFLQNAFQRLFDYDDDELIFKWLNANCFNDTNNDSNQNRPDGIVENDKKAVGYFEVKPISHAKNHRKINIDLHRLCVFSKTGSAAYKAKHMFQIMAVGTNIQFHLSQVRGDVLIVIELDSIRLPLSLDELPQMIPYLDRLYNVVDTIYRCCYENNTADVLSEFGNCLEPKVIKAITEKTTDRTRTNCFYHPYH
ncbi:hypothetical protein G6F35_008151 [Rhizopus arrhizus]|nr:hypothetical protein G6F23_011761 [Rhizopus arrhizus]KAG0907796.1 hypothetical protein G6F33_010259 [Rhizopus arrhizus]KAG1218650.1 hypothetical protein G6F35_008151 [Rhizopus arrhizus]